VDNSALFAFCQHSSLLSACLTGSLHRVESAIGEHASNDNDADDARARARTRSLVNQCSTNGFCALHAAVCSGSSDSLCIVKLLLHHGAFVNCRDADGFTALMANSIWAPSEEHALDMARLLVHHGAEVGCCMCDGRAATEFCDDAGFTRLSAWLNERENFDAAARMRARAVSVFNAVAKGRIVLASVRNPDTQFSR
jgi:ankyrin repeat protein